MTGWRTACKLLVHEIHSSKLLPFHENWRAFTYTPWLPYKLPHQLLYVAYRWALVVYFFIWLILSGTSQGSGIYFIYLTNWAHITYNSYLIIAAISTTWRMISATYWDSEHKRQALSPSQDYLSIAEPSDYLNLSNNRLSWYQMIHWVFYSIGNESALCVMVLYWSFLYRGGEISGVNANTHLLNGILSLVDMWISGLPVNYLHVVYILTFTVCYCIFSGLYFIGTGVIIYPVLDYESNTGAAVGLYLALTFLFLPLLHFLVYLMYLCKQWVVYRACAVRHARWAGATPSSSERHSVELTNMRGALSNDPENETL